MVRAVIERLAWWCGGRRSSAMASGGQRGGGGLLGRGRRRSVAHSLVAKARACPGEVDGELSTLFEPWTSQVSPEVRAGAGYVIECKSG